MTADELWAALAQDPRDPAFAGLRASDRDREVVRSLLATAYADGRLDRTEFDERSAAVTAARTLADLPPLVSDLVASAPARTHGLTHADSGDLAARARRQYESDRREALATFLLPSAICLVIWSVVMFGEFFWPAFVIAGTGINLAQTLMRRQDIIDRHLQRLEEKQAKELDRQRRLELERPPGSTGSSGGSGGPHDADEAGDEDGRA
ncbi:DUF1707 domain-containing protein [Nocardioides sp. cx-173]|uniref:DUF1707 SHOCT-like domain-containing protein n=1 Tax=Nocardioides sp. cx-173 TaxID=2898796 RepID=UPI001E5CC416|nr:DUF1707 domain-containing protein [Nocardioides sp. cx-173]MCD4526028.1 DUF1707 domain-containing protein [Nocardioides sp. cx-173]UGB43723.1 DUF1707 domain-containing protein [Nocardioides sp. cx-173]